MIYQTITSTTSHKEYLKDLWKHRFLLSSFMMRDIRVKYKQAVLGIMWAIIKPLLTVMAFVMVFRGTAVDPGQHYHLFVIGPVLIWLLFSSSFTDSSNTLLVHSHMITKIYFPRMLLPINCVLVNWIDYQLIAATTMFLVILMGLPHDCLSFILLSLLTAVLSVACALWSSAITVRHRDFKFIAPYLIQLGLFISPIGYSSSNIPTEYILLYSINPLVGIMEGARYCLRGGSYFQHLTEALCLSVCVTTFLLVTGYLYFKNMEYTMDEVI